MRSLIFITLLTVGLGCADTKNTTMASGKLNGTWVPVKQEMRGALLPKAALENQKLTIHDNTYTMIAESTDKGELKYADGKMDIYGKDGPSAGKHITAIYKFENDELTICYNLLGDGYPETFETKDKPMYFFSVFKRQ